jgi:hypothetical protein
MQRFFFSWLFGIAVGVVIGLYIGWVVDPVRVSDAAAAALDRRYLDDYTVMVANGFGADDDLNGAVERLRDIGIENAPFHVLEITERYITNSRDVADIRVLVVLYQAMSGRATPLMQPYLPVEGAP